MQRLLAAIALTVTACSAASIQRLPTTVWPTQYTLDIATDPLGDNFTGNVTIEAEVREDTDNITLHARRLTLGTARLQLVDQEQGVTETEVTVASDAENDLVVVTVSKSLRQGAHLRLTLPFSGTLNRRQAGYFRVKTGSQDWEWISGTVFEMNHAREAFPCFDEPQFKAHFRLNLAHHSNHTAVSNMPLLSSSTLEEDDWLVDHFDNSPLMPSYLVAYHLLQWDYREVKTDDGRPLRVWAPSKMLRWANKSLEFAPRALAWLQDYTGVNEPMPKIDFVAVPRFPGALENWGVISFAPSAVLFKPQSDGVLRETFYAQLIAHELAHSWFGNLITPQWWDSVWLSEGSASFFASLAVDQLEPSWDQFAEESESQLYQTYFDNAADIRTRPLGKPMEDSKELRHIEQSNYYKGFSFLRMLYLTLGPDHFQKGIRRYVTRQQFGSAQPKDLFDAFQYNYNGTDLNDLMYSWIYQPGLPVVTAHRSQGQLFLSQERFRINCEYYCPPITPEEKWWVPISYTTRSENNVNTSEPKLWFRENMSIPDPAKPEEWLLLNLNAAGTYHVRYDKENLELIMDAITRNSTEIPTHSKFQIVTDYGLFALEDSSPLKDVLDIMEFLSKETHFAPWASALNTFWRIDGRLKGTPAGIKFQDHVRNLLTPEFNRLGLRPRKGESMATVRQRRQIVEHACLYHLPDCVVRSGAFFQKWMKQQKPDKVNPIPPELRFTVYCSAMRSGSINQWHFLKERALAAKDTVHRETLFSALGCSNKYHLLYGLMNDDLNNSTMTRADFTRVLQGLVHHNNDIGPVLTYMQDSMVKMKSTSKKKMRWNKNLLRDLSHQIVDSTHLEQITMMISSSKVWPESEVASIKQQVESNIKWRQKYMNAL